MILEITKRVIDFNLFYFVNLTGEPKMAEKKIRRCCEKHIFILKCYECSTEYEKELCMNDSVVLVECPKCKIKGKSQIISKK